MNRIADLTWHRPKLVLAAVGLFAVLSLAFGHDVERHLKAAGFTDSASESEQAGSLLRGALGYDPNPGLVVVVRSPDGGKLDLADAGFRREVGALNTEMAGAKYVGRVVNPLTDRRAATTLIARDGDANIARAALTLPHSEFLEQSHIRTICTRVQLAAHACPKAAVYGHARAKTPLLDDELAGPVYLVSSDNELPDLLVDLRGQVNVRLRGVISAVAGRIKTVFRSVPDVPVSKFVLTMKGGKKGLLVNSRNLCAKRAFSHLTLKGQNGKKLIKKRLRLRVPACGKKGKKRGR